MPYRALRTVHRPQPRARVMGWPSIRAEHRHLPIALLDLDGTLRGDIVPMVRLANALLPNTFWNAVQDKPSRWLRLLQFFIRLMCLWALRTFAGHHRRRYKTLFSELHTLAAATLRGIPVEQLRARYQTSGIRPEQVWLPGAIELLRTLTESMVVVIVTGSEQVQTEECVHWLKRYGVDTSRIYVRGSRYQICPDSKRYTGKTEQLNVTLDGKRDAVSDLLDNPDVLIAMGNSRPDRALFERVAADGVCALVVPSRIAAGRSERGFTVRKFLRCGYVLKWPGEPDSLGLPLPQRPTTRLPLPKNVTSIHIIDESLVETQMLLRLVQQAHWRREQHRFKNSAGQGLALHSIP